MNYGYIGLISINCPRRTLFSPYEMHRSRICDIIPRRWLGHICDTCSGRALGIRMSQTQESRQLPQLDCRLHASLLAESPTSVNPQKIREKKHSCNMNLNNLWMTWMSRSRECCKQHGGIRYSMQQGSPGRLNLYGKQQDMEFLTDG
jgi:hypothetical protein